MAFKPSLPQKIVRAGPWNHVHLTSPIWGSEGRHKAAAGLGGGGEGASQGAGIILSLAAISRKLGCSPLCPSVPLLPCSPFLQLLVDLLKMLITSPSPLSPLRTQEYSLPVSPLLTSQNSFPTIFAPGLLYLLLPCLDTLSYIFSWLLLSLDSGISSNATSWAIELH